jgi:hypothetical protein
MVAEEVSEGRLRDMPLAATEVATNAIQHGGGVEEARVGRAWADSSARLSTDGRPDGTLVVTWITWANR